MRSPLACLTLLLLGLVVLAPMTALAASFVTNGSLENGNFSNTACSYMQLPASSTTITGWTVSATTINNVAWGQGPTCDGISASDGSYFVDLTGFGAESPNGALEQTLSGMVLNQTYTFSMDVHVDSSLPSVMIGSTSITLTAGTPFVVGTTTWTPESGTFVATSSSGLLVIANQLSGQQIDFIDNIAVDGPAATPEPGTLILLAAGLLGLRRKLVRS